MASRGSFRGRGGSGSFGARGGGSFRGGFGDRGGRGGGNERLFGYRHEARH